MQPSSTGVLLGLLFEAIQPSSVLPSKSRIQPSAFSFSVSSLSAAHAGGAVAISSRAAETIGILISVHHLLLLGPQGDIIRQKYPRGDAVASNGRSSPGSRRSETTLLDKCGRAWSTGVGVST